MRARGSIPAGKGTKATRTTRQRTARPTRDKARAAARAEITSIPVAKIKTKGRRVAETITPAAAAGLISIPEAKTKTKARMAAGTPTLLTRPAAATDRAAGMPAVNIPARKNHKGPRLEPTLPAADRAAIKDKA